MAQASLIRQHIADFAFQKLFNVLGWDNFPPGSKPQYIEADDALYTLSPVLEKKGLQVFQCSAAPNGAIPPLTTRKKISRKLAAFAYEHLIIFTDAAERTQQWQWIVRAKGQPQTPHGAKYVRGQDATALAQKLHRLSVTLDEDARLGIVDMSARAQAAFKANEDVTKRFYPLFRKQYEAFLGFIAGIADTKECEWYASLMLNRLMFVYFIQSKGFLANDTDYLRHKYDELEAKHGKGHFFDFYRTFLLRLFHDGLATRDAERTSDLAALIGDVPYLNGGLFEPHEIERRNDIRIPDEAFDAILTFFDGWTWHLDTRSERSGREINPDVLGYIFEQFINRKQMGAYYTKEDITGYIAKNTIIPWVFDAAQKDDAIAFRADGEVWRWLRERPDDYLYAAVKQGVIGAEGAIIPLPAEIEAGIGDVSQRTGWNRPAAPDYALPTETWREHVARRERCLALRERLKNGAITAINDLITDNLDIQAFAQDVLIYCESPDLLRAFYDALTRVTVLDPTCGSGAFLFAALNVLAPLYQACLEGMRRFVDDGTASHAAHIFGTILTEMNAPPNPEYFVTKTIIVNNLYGVDIMSEAVETCKVRLFLRLAAQLEHGGKIEPLPDIDFNVRAGNTLIGYASEAAFRASATSRFSSMFGDADGIIHQARVVDGLLDQFRKGQTAYGAGGDVTQQSKATLKTAMDQLSGQLDKYLAAEYGIVADDNANDYESRFARWNKMHQPFHWFSEFYGVMQRGGFDVIIGNPPYVEYYPAKFDYLLTNFDTLACANLYTCVVERSQELLNLQGLHGMILPLSAFATKNMSIFIEKFEAWFPMSWLSFYHFRPSMLFSGGKVASIPTCIYIVRRNGTERRSSTGVVKWFGPNRSRVFSGLTLCDFSLWKDLRNRHYYPKIGDSIEADIAAKVLSNPSIDRYVDNKVLGNDMFYRSAGGLYWKIFINFPWPYVTTSNKRCSFMSGYDRDVFVALFSSSLFWWYYTATFDTFNLKDYMLFGFRFSYPDDQVVTQLKSLCGRLMSSYKENAEHLKRGSTGSYTVYAKDSKGIIDEIDRVLARHYGFTDEELDYLINYDIKYRMGQESADDA